MGGEGGHGEEDVGAVKRWHKEGRGECAGDKVG